MPGVRRHDGQPDPFRVRTLCERAVIAIPNLQALRLDGVSMGRVDRDSTVPVAMATVATVALALPVEKQTTQERLKALGSGTHTFAVEGTATFRTPFGTREVRFEQEGAMTFGERPGR